MSEKRKWGDRLDGRRVRDVPGLQSVMANLMPNRTESEVYLHETLDVTELLRYIEKRNEGEPEYKTTLFHCFILGLARMVKERPMMNRFIQGRRTYQRDEISLSFVCKRRFTDHSEEALMVLKPKDTDTLDDISRKIVGDVREVRKSEHATGGVDSIVDGLGKLPRPLLMFAIWMIRVLDFWGKLPRAIWDGDPNYTTILCSNLGSIKCPAVYHHLNNYGTNSIMVTIGAIHKAPMVMEDGSIEARDVVDIGATLDERIADGFYFARSLKLMRHICANPTLLDKPLGEPSEYEYK
ncbi:MAG TPA: 2-oxo acid dehydrogenase subunit E2 [Candidatus Faecousia faecipullorum]|nr:2-oxo acid dehydrogenase subunit E2 [Candidatus Faecousia faecipullorum]